ncbi:AbrB family transcriptional regulator [Lacticaseibacillus chiayiensis]|uniref:AbrB family transcriptional regulator n=1 Tax=Lacticaseibacillus chiayiensis TaxID=2100821 RepID=A0A4Q1U2F2_9LACO|nr:AbrB family transcriptional regulator [Lacticaseibacillus chiayiensis]QVI35083.1 AbrB family transcriptional regulator [Lacticaseibacillus chiayiensis]RXT24718.1 AbrB family transcriptional regulator [Lacticaseibacillus chiayiensis]UYN56866.1 AbrB family transcriptional regulator [Lacticaseibacillus chiayiensis]
MDKVKARQQGSELVIPLPSKFNVQAGQEFYVMRDSGGTLTLMPKLTDFFENVQPGEFVDEDDELAREFLLLQDGVDE